MEQHPDIGRFVRKFRPGCGTERHIPLCSKVGDGYNPMKYSSFEFPGQTVTVDVLTKDFNFDLHILSSYKDKIKKSNACVGAAFQGDFPLWWNPVTNKKHFSSLCTACDNTFVACDFNLHQCVTNGIVAKIDVNRVPPVKTSLPAGKPCYW